MGRGRLEAFSDGVLAIIITIMVLELKVPHSTDLAALMGLSHVFAGYVLSFVYIGIYWNNHHHLMHTVERVTGGIMWANAHLLFWLSLVPFATAWLGETAFAAPLPAALYGFLLFMSAVAYTILTLAIKAAHGPGSKIERAIGRDLKGMVSLGIYAVGMAVAWWTPVLASVLFGVVALIWLIPDRRIERVAGK